MGARYAFATVAALAGLATLGRSRGRGGRNSATGLTLESGICHGDADEGADDNILYHALPERLLAKVMREGLAPSTGDVTFGGLSVWSHGKIFLSAGWENATKWQGFIGEALDEDVAILEVTLPPELFAELEVDTVSSDEGDPCSFYLQREIPAQHLAVADTGIGTNSIFTQRE